MRHALALLLPSLLALSLPRAARAQEFRDLNAGITGVGLGSNGDMRARVSLQDFDKDGDLDVLVQGTLEDGYQPGSEIWRNDGGGRYSKFAATRDFAEVWKVDALDWGDLDGDGYAEIAAYVNASYSDPSGNFRDSGFVGVYGARSGSFHAKAFALPLAGMIFGNDPVLRLADIDKDGYPDLFVSAWVRPGSLDYAHEELVTRAYRNEQGSGWTEIPGIVPMDAPYVAFGDLDADGDLDLVMAGPDEQNTPVLMAYRYDAAGRAFLPYATVSPGFPAVSIAIADYNGDGRGDLALVSGYFTPATRLYRNTGAGFAADAAPLPASANVDYGLVSFGDIDGDGDPDLLVSGTAAGNAHVTRLFRNNAGAFAEIPANLPAYWYSTGMLADFDKDGTPDVILAGYTVNDKGQGGVTTTFIRNLRGDFRPQPAADSLAGPRPRWIDFDADGDLDLVACGSACRLYRNDGGILVRQSSALDAGNGDPEVGDLDGDGRADILVAGKAPFDGDLRWYRNTGGDFLETPLGLDPGLRERIRHARMADFDGDGKPDLVAWGRGFDTTDASGNPARACYSGLLRNLGGGNFAPAPKGALPGQCDMNAGANAEIAWGDFDRDGDPDLLFAGDTANWTSPYTVIFRNEGGEFAPTGDRLLGLSQARVAWGDFDGDGDLDFAETGMAAQGGPSNPNSAAVTVIYRLVGGRFEEYARPAGSNSAGDAAWIDFDNDGDLDLLVSGSGASGSRQTSLYRNNGTTLTEIRPEGSALSGQIAVGDYDADGDVDFAVSGFLQSNGRGVLKPFRNSLVSANAAPAAPGGLSATLGMGSVQLAWGASADAETGPDGMEYNLRVGTAPGAADVVSPLSRASGGRLAPAPGNAGHIRAATLIGLAPGTYYWSAQGVDMQTAGSAFAPEASFTLGLPAPELVGAEAGPGAGAITLRWRRLPQPHFKRYLVHYGTQAAPAARMDSVARASDTALTVSGLADGTLYHFRLSAADLGGNPSPFSNELTATPDGTPPAVPAPLAALPGDRSVALAWPAAAEGDFLCYLVYQRNAAGPWARIDSIPDARVTAKSVGGLKNGTPYGFLIDAVDRVGNHSGYSPEAVAIPAYLLTPASPALDFGKVGLGASAEGAVRIANGSGLRVPIDSVRIVNAAFAMPSLPPSLPAQAETSLTVRFAPGKPAGGDFAGALKLYYGGAPSPLEIALSGSAAAPPWCRIDKIAPSDLGWDETASISFLASANDSDNAGQGDRITAYLWSSSLSGPLAGDASGFTAKAGALGIGAHDITLRVVDNEGDTSLAAHASLRVRSRKPRVAIDSVSPRGLIIRGADRPRIRCTAYDLDEGADAAHDSLHAFAVYSTLQGLLSGAKDTTLDSAALILGLHGFYAMAVDDEGDTAWSDTSWVPVQAGVGLALIAAGTDFNDNLYFQQNIAPNCNWAYSKLRQRGFTDSLITYFNPIGWQSIGAAYKENSRIVDETRMRPGLLRERVLGYRDRVRAGVPLLIALIGHGGHTEKQNGMFFLGPDSALTPDSLDAWLDTYDDGSGDSLATPIMVLLDFCNAGTFLPKLRSSTQNRIVIASSAPDRQAYYQNGQSFSYAFFREASKGSHLGRAWAAGREWSDANALAGKLANPQANADLDDIPNEPSDFARLSDVYLGGSQQNQALDVTWKELALAVNPVTRTATIRAVPEKSLQGIDTAWFALYTPGSDADSAGGPSAYSPLGRRPDGSFEASLGLDNVLAGEYLALVYGLAGGLDMMPSAKRIYVNGAALALPDGTPERFGLGQNFPNPARGRTTIPFALAKRGPMTLTLWDMRGAEIRTLAEGVFRPGKYVLEWDGLDGHGRPTPAGIYTFRLRSPEGTLRRKLVWR